MSTVYNNTSKLGWIAELNLNFSRSKEKTFLSKRNHIGPLTIQRPFYPEGDICHVYLLHPPGGIVGGDSLTVNTNSEEFSKALITTVSGLSLAIPLMFIFQYLQTRINTQYESWDEVARQLIPICKQRGRNEA